MNMHAAALTVLRGPFDGREMVTSTTLMALCMGRTRRTLPLHLISSWPVAMPECAGVVLHDYHRWASIPAVRRFNESYRHQSVNKRDYESFCLWRWLVFAQFAIEMPAIRPRHMSMAGCAGPWGANPVPRGTTVDHACRLDFSGHLHFSHRNLVGLVGP